MLIEVPLVLRVTLYVGHPSRGAAIVLGSLLFGAGLGSMRVARLSESGTRATLLALPVLALIVALAIGPAVALTISWGLPIRIALATMIIVSVGLVMGAALPAGMMRFDDVDRSWLWAVNSGASVLASALAVALSIAFGFTVTMVLAVVGYLFVALIWLRSGPAPVVAREQETPRVPRDSLGAPS
jgi:hypothetical protein